MRCCPAAGGNSRAAGCHRLHPQLCLGPGKCCPAAGSVTIYNVDPGVTPLELDQQFSVHGEVRDVRASPQIQGCWVIEYYDIRHAAAALQALNRTASYASLPVVNESSSSQQMRSMQGLRDVQSSHVLSSHDAPGGRAPSDESWQVSQGLCWPCCSGRPAAARPLLLSEAWLLLAARSAVSKDVPVAHATRCNLGCVPPMQA